MRIEDGRYLISHGFFPLLMVFQDFRMGDSGSVELLSWFCFTRGWTSHVAGGVSLIEHLELFWPLEPGTRMILPSLQQIPWA